MLTYTTMVLCGAILLVTLTPEPTVPADPLVCPGVPLVFRAH